MPPTAHFPSIHLALFAVAGGLALLTLGGEFLVSGATKLAARLGMTTLLIGLTVVAFGTSMPELFIGVVALFQGHSNIMVGNVVGSNIANVGLILGISALLTTLAVPFAAIAVELYLVLAASLLFALITWHGVFGRLPGLVFIAVLAAYTFISYTRASATRTGLPAAEQRPLPLIILLLIAGFAQLAYGSELFIAGAVDVARYLGVSELVIGLTLVAVGTSLPELASSLAAIRQRQGELLVGNIVGSNLFNLLMVLGCGALFKPFPLGRDLLLRDLPVMFGFSVVLIPFCLNRRGLGRGAGLALLLAYLGYMYLLASNPESMAGRVPAP